MLTAQAKSIKDKTASEAHNIYLLNIQLINPVTNKENIKIFDGKKKTFVKIKLQRMKKKNCEKAHTNTHTARKIKQKKNSDGKKNDKNFGILRTKFRIKFFKFVN